ncbi:hypothetical protein MSB02_00775 [Coriobacteriia bacterium M08DHB]|nr:hypothetical protein [Anaerosoma tenue]
MAVVLVMTIFWAASSRPAAAYPDWDPAPSPLAAEDCDHCHSATSSGGTAEWDGSGPHGGYLTSTNKCQLCHVVHKSPSDSVVLLRTTTVTGMCIMCHDGTGSSIGVYSTIEAHGGTVAAEHRVEVTDIVPGGSSALGSALGCSDCHSVHGSNTVAPFLRDSGRAYAADEYVISDCLLRNDVRSGVPDSVPEYGALWCAACHDERHSGSGTTVNHPVDGDSSWGYGDVRSTIRTDDSWREALTGGVATGMGRTNSGYLMAPVESAGDGRIEEVDRRDPMCQQCHEDARDVETVFSADYTMRGTEPWNTPVNPVFVTFPHQTTNDMLLVEQYDDLCTNCHPVTGLP